MIEIKITGNSIPELADKLLAMGSALRVQSVNDADNAARDATGAGSHNANTHDPHNSDHAAGHDPARAGARDAILLLLPRRQSCAEQRHGHHGDVRAGP